MPTAPLAQNVLKAVEKPCVCLMLAVYGCPASPAGAAGVFKGRVTYPGGV